MSVLGLGQSYSRRESPRADRQRPLPSVSYLSTNPRALTLSLTLTLNLNLTLTLTLTFTLGLASPPTEALSESLSSPGCSGL